MFLKPLEKKDLELLLAWRNHPRIYKYQESQKGILNWEHHYNWYKNRKHRKDWIIIYNNRKIGTVDAIKMNTAVPELGIYIGEISLWGKGLGAKAISLLIDILKDMGYKKVHATTNKKNKQSNALWKKLNFTCVKSVKNNKEWLYEKEI